MTTDVVLVQINKYFDIPIDENGDLENEDFFDTALKYSIYGERRASESEMPVSERRRGWIGNVGKDFENGSKIWLYEQARDTRSNRNGIANAALDSLRWLVQDNYLKEIDTSVTVRDNRVILSVVLYRFNSEVDTRFFDLWENTGIR